MIKAVIQCEGIITKNIEKVKTNNSKIQLTPIKHFSNL